MEDGTVATVGVPGNAVDPLFISTRGTNEFSPRPQSDQFDLLPFVNQLNDATELQSSIYGETWSSRLKKAISDNGLLLNVLQNTQLTTTFPPGEYNARMQAVSTLIKSHKQRGTDRDVFFVSVGEYDHHDVSVMQTKCHICTLCCALMVELTFSTYTQRLKSNLATEFTRLNTAMQLFTDEIKAQGYWDNVTVVMASDFARTLTANSGMCENSINSDSSLCSEL